MQWATLAQETGNLQLSHSLAKAGSEMSSLLCHCGGIIRPSNPMDQESSYSCDQCGLVLDNTYVIILETQLKDDLELCYTNDTIALEEVLRFIKIAYIYYKVGVRKQL